MLNLKKIIEKMKNDPKKLLMNLFIVVLFGVLLILIGDITGNLTDKKSKNRTNSVEVDATATDGFNASGNNQQAQTSENGTTQAFGKKMKQDLIDTLSEIEGVGRITLMINYESGEQAVPAFNETGSSKRIEEKDKEGGTRITTESSKNQEIVLVENGSEHQPLVVKQYNPKICGLVIVAEGAENPVVKERLFHAAKTVLNLPGDMVSVMPMKKSSH